MADMQTLEDRKERLGAAIAAARAKLEARRNLDDESIGALLAEMNEDLDQITHADEDAAEREYNKIEARLAAERITIEDDKDEEEEG